MSTEELEKTREAAANPATACPFKARYDNFIGGTFKAPNAGRYFENTSPITGLGSLSFQPPFAAVRMCDEYRSSLTTSG